MEILRYGCNGVIDRREIGWRQSQRRNCGGEILGKLVDRGLVANIIGAGKEFICCRDCLFHIREVHIIGGLHHLCLVENRVELGNISREIGKHCDRILECGGSRVDLSLIGRGKLIVCIQLRFGSLISGVCLSKTRSVVMGGVQSLEAAIAAFRAVVSTNTFACATANMPT